MIKLKIEMLPRDSIAHITRIPTKDHKGLELDILDELRHLNNICNALKIIVRYRLLDDMGIKENQNDEYLLLK